MMLRPKFQRPPYQHTQTITIGPKISQIAAFPALEVIANTPPNVIIAIAVDVIARTNNTQTIAIGHKISQIAAIHAFQVFADTLPIVMIAFFVNENAEIPPIVMSAIYVDVIAPRIELKDETSRIIRSLSTKMLVTTHPIITTASILLHRESLNVT